MIYVKSEQRHTSQSHRMSVKVTISALGSGRSRSVGSGRAPLLVQVNGRPAMLFADDDAWNCDTDFSDDSRDHRLAEEERRAEAQRQQQREKAAANKTAPAPNPLHILRSPIRGSGSSSYSASTLRRRGEPAKVSTATGAEFAPAPAPAKPMTSLFKQLNWSLENARRRNSGRSMPASARCPEADARPDQADARGTRLAHGAPGTSLCLLCCRSR